jgi:enoyl-[acyl-carrier protein] reductase I
MLQGKRGLILGVANKRSIAHAIATKASEAGAELALTFAGERLKQNVVELAEPLRAPLILPCDVSKDEEIDQLFDTLQKEWGGIDFVVHAIAFANKEELNGEFVQTSRAGYHLAQDISSYSLTAIARRAKPLMEGRSGSIIALTYLGGQRVVPNYNVMGVAKAALEASVRYLAADLGPHGIRVNALSAGPIKTLSAAGVSNFSRLLSQMPERAPLRRNVTADEVGDAAIFFLSDLSRAVTGECLFVDCGFHVLGV